MSSYLLLWNPNRFGWPDLPHMLDRADHGEPATHRWGVGNRTHLPSGSLVYLLETGQNTPGIRARGVTTSAPEKGPRLEDEEREHMQVWVQFLELQDRDEAAAVPRELLQHDPATQDFDWTPQRGGVEIPPRVEARVALLWQELYGHRTEQHPIVLDSRAYEGDIVVRLVQHRRREKSLRSKKLAISANLNRYQLICEVCELNLTERFSTAVGFMAEVHHTVPLSQYDEPQATDLDDLAVVCPTCHRFIHSRTPIYSVGEARERLGYE